MKNKNLIKKNENTLFDWVVYILEEAHSNVVRAVNSNMVMAYWLIGREIVEEIQGGEQRAEYGKQILANLSRQLNNRYGTVFSVPNLQNFRKFYLAFQTRAQIQYPSGTKSQNPENINGSNDSEKQYQVGTKSIADLTNKRKLSPSGREFQNEEKDRPAGDELQNTFNPNLSWSHYRALMRVKNCEARNFYEKESAE
jgi:hypothetical protein